MTWILDAWTAEVGSGARRCFVSINCRNAPSPWAYVDPDVRTVFKVATFENGTTMQEDIVSFITEYSDPVLRRMKRNGA